MKEDQTSAVQCALPLPSASCAPRPPYQDLFDGRFAPPPGEVDHDHDNLGHDLGCGGDDDDGLSTPLLEQSR